MKCSFRTFLDIISQVYSVAENAFGISAKHEIEDLVKSQISNQVADLLKQHLHIEKNRNDEFEKVLKERKYDLKGIDSKKVKRSSKDEHIDTEEATSKKLELTSVEGILQTSAASRPMESNSATVIQALSGSAVVAGDVGTLTIVQNPLTSQRKEELPPYSEKDIGEFTCLYLPQIIHGHDFVISFIICMATQHKHYYHHYGTQQ